MLHIGYQGMSSQEKAVKKVCPGRIRACQREGRALVATDRTLSVLHSLCYSSAQWPPYFDHPFYSILPVLALPAFLFYDALASFCEPSPRPEVAQHLHLHSTPLSLHSHSTHSTHCTLAPLPLHPAPVTPLTPLSVHVLTFPSSRAAHSLR